MDNSVANHMSPIDPRVVSPYHRHALDALTPSLPRALYYK